MKRIEVIRIMQKISKEKGFKFTQDEMNELIDMFGETILEVARNLDKKENGKYDTANIGVVTVTKREKPARKGVCTLNDEPTEWEKPAKEVVVVKLKKSAENESSEEL